MLKMECYSQERSIDQKLSRNGEKRTRGKNPGLGAKGHVLIPVVLKQ